MTINDKDIVEAYIKYGSKTAAAKYLDMPRTTYRRRFDQIQSIDNLTPVGFKTTKVSTDGSGTVTARTHKLRPETDDEERTGTIVRRSTLYGADGSVTGEWVIRKPESVEEKFSDVILETFKEEIPKVKSPALRVTDNDNRLSLINIVDDHMNLRAFAQESGEDFDIEKAFNLYASKFEELVNSLPSTNYVMLTNLGDQFHNNDHMKVTPASKHSLDTDLTFAQAAKYVINLNRFRIEKLLEKFEEVYIRGVRGNHDEDAMVLLFAALEIAYEDNDRVHVFYNESGTHVELYGNTLLAFDHGDKGKPELCAGYIASEHASTYGQSKYRYIHTGHVHHEQEKDIWGGFLWRSHRTLSAKDKYTSSNKYHSPRSIKGYVIHPEKGEQEIKIVNV